MWRLIKSGASDHECNIAHITRPRRLIKSGTSDQMHMHTVNVASDQIGGV